MGDAAEYALQQWLDALYDDSEPYWLDRAPKTCRYCGAIDIEWGKSKGKWVLFDNTGNTHVCSAKKAFDGV